MPAKPMLGDPITHHDAIESQQHQPNPQPLAADSEQSFFNGSSSPLKFAEAIKDAIFGTPAAQRNHPCSVDSLTPIPPIPFHLGQSDEVHLGHTEDRHFQDLETGQPLHATPVSADQPLQSPKRIFNFRAVTQALGSALSGNKKHSTNNKAVDDQKDGATDDDDDDRLSIENRSKRTKKKKHQKPPPVRPTISKARLKVFVGTWNMMGQMPSSRDGLTGFLDVINPQHPDERARLPVASFLHAPHEQQDSHQQQHHQPDLLSPDHTHTGLHPSLSTSNLLNGVSTEPPTNHPTRELDSYYSNPDLTASPLATPTKEKSRKRRASDLLKRIRHPYHGPRRDPPPLMTSSSSTLPSQPGILTDPYLEMTPKAPYHIIAINTQECEREIREAVLFPSKSTWEKHLQTVLGPDYVMLKTETMAALHIAVFIWKPIEGLVSGQFLPPLRLAVDSSIVATGIGGIVGNKGAVAISVYLGSTSFLFVNAHLTAHQNNTQQRNNDYKRIIQELQLNDAPKRHPRGWHFRGDMKLRRHYNPPVAVLKKQPTMANLSQQRHLDKSSTHNSNSDSKVSPISNKPTSKQGENPPPTSSKSLIHNGVLDLGQKDLYVNQFSGDPRSAITSEINSNISKVDVTDQFDYTFWAGDLNYRVEMSRAEADACLQKDDIETLLSHDQLLAQRAAGAVFNGFNEAPITFKPTYKFDPLVPISDSRLKRHRSLAALKLNSERPQSMVSLNGEMSNSRLINLEMNRSCPDLLVEGSMGHVGQGPTAWRILPESFQFQSFTSATCSAKTR
ncbi:inositol polyphosphate 5-phosphatase [Podila humilis]|nr:inositol polyphosphate 5-phosphatase [Podila humilis]